MLVFGLYPITIKIVLWLYLKCKHNSKLCIVDTVIVPMRNGTLQLSTECVSRQCRHMQLMLNVQSTSSAVYCH